MDASFSSWCLHGDKSAPFKFCASCFESVHWSITLQFHVVFDDWFGSVAVSPDDLPNFSSDEWTKMFGDSSFQFLPDDDNDEPSPDTSDTDASSLFASRWQAISDTMATTTPPTPLPTAPLPIAQLEGAAPSAPCSPPTPGPVAPIGDSAVGPVSPAPVQARHQREGTPFSLQPVQQRESTVPSTHQREPPSTKPAVAPTAVPTPSPSVTQRHSTCQCRPVQHLKMDPANTTYAANVIVTSDDVFECLAMPIYHALLLQFNLYNPEVCKAAVSNPDTLLFDQILLDPDLDKWKESAAKEIEALESKGTWKEVQKHEAKSKILPRTWVFRRKRTPTGVIRKCKGHFCVHGDLQEGDFDTFAPVVAWATICLVLVFALTQGWRLICIDFSNAFIQAELAEPVWIHLPRGYKSTIPGATCLQLKKSLYGLSITTRLWYEHLGDTLLKDGFKQWDYDPCLWLKSNMIIFLYVDDCGLAATNQKDIDNFMEQLNKAGFKLPQDGDFGEYLGIKFNVNSQDNTITMTQPGLIQKVIEATGMSDCNPNHTPAAQVFLGSDVDGPPMKEKWSYPSLVGMLLYLSTNTRPDITYAVSQVVRFGSNPKQSHAYAIKMIVRYLAGMADKGTIFTPNDNFKIDCYVDADFTGLHGQESENNPLVQDRGQATSCSFVVAHCCGNHNCRVRQP